MATINRLILPIKVLVRWNLTCFTAEGEVECCGVGLIKKANIFLMQIDFLFGMAPFDRVELAWVEKMVETSQYSGRKRPTAPTGFPIIKLNSALLTSE